jgi:hypothetical protein
MRIDLNANLSMKRQLHLKILLFPSCRFFSQEESKGISVGIFDNTEILKIVKHLFVEPQVDQLLVGG